MPAWVTQPGAVIRYVRDDWPLGMDVAGNFYFLQAPYAESLPLPLAALLANPVSPIPTTAQMNAAIAAAILPPLKSVSIVWTAASGTSGGPATSGSWRTYTTDSTAAMTLLDPTGYGFCTLATPSFTLTAGTYQINGEFSFYATAESQAKLLNATAAADVTPLGLVGYANVVASAACVSAYKAEVTIAATTTFTPQYRVVTSQAAVGLGRDSTFGTNYFGQIFISKSA